MPPQIRAAMDRRIFVVTITGGVLATPLAALPQSLLLQATEIIQ
jgi:hypothetical protein